MSNTSSDRPVIRNRQQWVERSDGEGESSSAQALKRSHPPMKRIGFLLVSAAERMRRAIARTSTCRTRNPCRWSAATNCQLQCH